MTGRVLLLAVLAWLLAAPAAAWAEDDAAAARALRSGVEKALGDHDFEQAASAVVAVIEAPEKRSVRFYVDATELVLELFPHELGNPFSAALASLGLEVGSPANSEAWSNAQAVRRRLLDDADTDTGVWYLEKLMAFYDPGKVPVRLRYDLAYLYLDAGLQDRAAEAFQTVIAEHAAQAEARVKLAEILEDRGDLAGTLAQYDAVIRASSEQPPTGRVLLAHLNKARVLHHTARRYDDARAALQGLEDALSRAPLGRERQDYAQRLQMEREALGSTLAHRDEIVALKSRVNRLLGVTLLGLLLLLGGGVTLLARRGLA